MQKDNTGSCELARSDGQHCSGAIDAVQAKSLAGESGKEAARSTTNVSRTREPDLI
jgi:hypothetical protein